MKKTAFKTGYIILCVMTITNFIYDIFSKIAVSHIGANSNGFLRKASNFLIDLELNLNEVWLIIYVFLPVIVAIIISLIVFLFYRQHLPKVTVVLSCMGFLPYILPDVAGIGGALFYIVVGIAKIIYLIVMIVFMLKGISYLSQHLGKTDS